MATRQVNMRLAELDRARLDRLARARGLSRSELVRALLADADGAPTPSSALPSRLEAIEMLAEKARGGSVVAMVALERALRLGGDPAVAVPVKIGHVRLEDLTRDDLRAVG
jgi:Ribbon-helix-helix protein, copG family